MKQKIVIVVAPTSGAPNIANNPIEPDVIASDVVDCARSGASVVHMHARDDKGNLTTDLTTFNKTVNTIKNSCDIILEASTGGLSALTAQERLLPVNNPFAEIGSVNIGSLNFGDSVYQNGLNDVRFWLKELSDKSVKPNIEIFDTGDMESALNLVKEGLITLPINFSFIFNLQWGMIYHPSILSYLKERAPSNSQWGALLIGSKDFSQHLNAARNGASFLRVGFEDSNQCNGKTAGSNSELVCALREELESAGFSIATVEETRKILFPERF